MPRYNHIELIRELTQSLEFFLRFLVDTSNNELLKKDVEPLQTELKRFLERIDEK